MKIETVHFPCIWLLVEGKKIEAFAIILVNRISCWPVYEACSVDYVLRLILFTVFAKTKFSSEAELSNIKY